MKMVHQIILVLSPPTPAELGGGAQAVVMEGAISQPQPVVQLTRWQVVKASCTRLLRRVGL